MNLVWHQLRKDVRQFRVFLGIWGGLVLLDLAVSLGWVGQASCLPRADVDWVSNTWTGLLPDVLWAFVGLLPSLVVLADSPARREGFLAARPLPLRDLLLAKLLFVLGLIVAPWTLQELVHLTFQGMPGWVIAQGTFERLLVTLPVAVGFGAYAALWPGYARWARALAISVVGTYLLALGALAVNWFVLHSRAEPFDFSFAAGLVGVYGCTSALVLLAVWHARVHPGLLGRWGGLVVVALCYWLTGMLCPRDWLTLRPADAATAKSVMADVGFEIPPRSMSFQKQHNPDRVQFTVNLAPRTKPLPAGLVAEWSTRDSSLTRTAGGALPGGVRGGHTPLFNPLYWNPWLYTADFAAWASELPEDVLFRVEDHYLPGPQQSAAQAGRFDLPTSGKELTAPLTLQADLEARVFRWRKLAELPLTPGAKATDEFGRWEYVNTVSPSPMGAQLCVRRRQIELATARDSRCSSAYYGPLARQVIMVYDPQRHVAWLPSSTGNSTGRATHTALPQHLVTLHLNNRKPFTTEELARCRLLVFEKTWLGSVPETWQSPTFTLAEMLPLDSGMATGVNQRMPRAEFLRRIAALKTPAPAAARRDVSLYLLEFLRLVDARGRPLELSDPLTAQLARFVPAHLDLLLDGLPVMNWTSKRSVLAALQLGATDAQKPALIAALASEPELAGVIFARGWMEDARPEILQLANRPQHQPLPLSALRAIAWFHDPQTYPGLLEEFERQVNESQYEALRTLPGLEVQLAEIIRRRWREESLVVNSLSSQQYELFRLAIQLGETNALQRAFQLLDDPDFNVASQGWHLADALRPGVQMADLSPEKRQDYEAVLAWMRAHRPEDFVFDLARRQFVLKEYLAAREPVAAQKP